MAPAFDFDQVFDEDYPYSYEPRAEARRFTFSVRMFIAAELRDWLLDAGFQTVEFCDHAGEPLTARSSRMVTVARR